MTCSLSVIFSRGVFIGGVTGIILLINCNVSAETYPRVLGQNFIKHLVIKEARSLGLPASLALAVAHVESNFDPQAVSHAGARGVMQIMPATALGEYGIHRNKLWDPRTNIRLGLHYLGRLIGRYGGRTDLALSFYNGGSRVGRPGNARIIPATRKYIRKVQSLRFSYRQKILSGQLWGASAAAQREHKSRNHPRRIDR